MEWYYLAIFNAPQRIFYGETKMLYTIFLIIVFVVIIAFND